MKVGSLFTGIGGIDLGLERAGMEIAWQVEINPFCRKVLEKHWPNVPKYGDIRELRGDELEPVDLVCGGPPCQPYSSPGKRQGKNDERHLWPEMHRIIKNLHPDWVIFENVPGIIGMVLDSILFDLESIGYATATYNIPARAVGAPHERERIFVIANAGNKSEPQKNTAISSIREKWETWDYVSRSNRKQISRTYWEIYQPPILGVDDGIPNRLDRSKALGNAVVPKIPEIIGLAIMQMEEGMKA